MKKVTKVTYQMTKTGPYYQIILNQILEPIQINKKVILVSSQNILTKIKRLMQMTPNLHNIT